jgi:hypothetical protein
LKIGKVLVAKFNRFYRPSRSIFERINTLKKKIH